jgi:hypothetical protein
MAAEAKQAAEAKWVAEEVNKKNTRESLVSNKL